MRYLDVEAFGLEKGQAAGIAVDAIEDLIDQRLVADESTCVAARSGHEWERGNPVTEGEHRLAHAGLGLRVVYAQDPAGVGALVHCARREAYPRLVAASVCPRHSDAEALLTARHQVGQVRRRGVTRTETGEVGVLRGADELAAARGADADAEPRPSDMPARHPRRAEVAAAVAGQDLVSDLHVLDRLDRAVAHRHRRPLDEALIVVADNREVAVLGREQLEPAVLGVVGVLVLVDEDPAEGRGVAVADLLEELEQVDGAEQQVVEVHRVHAVELVLVVLVDVGDRLLEEGADHLAVVLGRAEAVLGVRDLGLDRSRGEALGVDVEVVEALLDQPP